MTKEYWVVPIGGSWVVRYEGHEIERYDEKMHAVLRAKALAKADTPSEVIVLDRGGGIEERRPFREDA
jgi:hypothetical protein